MARLAMATLAVLLLSLLAVASCRVLEVEAISDDQGPPNPADLTQEADAAEVILSSLPAPAVAEDEGVLWLPSHHCPCHRSHLLLARHHGISHHGGTLSGPGEARVHPASFPTDTELEHGEEYAHTEPELAAVAVAEPYPDIRPDTDGEKKPFHAKEYAVAHTEPKLEAVAVAEPDPDSRPDTDGDQTPFHAKEQMARFFGHHLHHHHEEDNDDDRHEQDKGEGTNMKLFGRFHHRHHYEEDEHEQHKDEGMIMKLLRRFHRHHAHGGDGEANNKAEPERGYSSFFKALMNRF